MEEEVEMKERKNRNRERLRKKTQNYIKKINYLQRKKEIHGGRGGHGK